VPEGGRGEKAPLRKTCVEENLEAEIASEYLAEKLLAAGYTRARALNQNCER